MQVLVIPNTILGMKIEFLMASIVSCRKKLLGMVLTCKLLEDNKLHKHDRSKLT